MDGNIKIQGHVLVVEDDDGLRKLIIKSLNKTGIEARGASLGAEALDSIASDLPAALLIDQQLPDMTGQHVIRNLEAQGIKIPFIMMTGQGDERLAVEMMKLGASDYLVKDMEFMDILPVAVNRLFHNIKTEQALRKSEKNLRESEERFRRVASIISDVVYSCTTDKDGVYAIDWMTGASEPICGYTVEEIVSLKCWRFLVDEEDIPVFEKNVTGLAPGRQASCELRIRHKNGAVVWIASHTECVSDASTSGRSVLYGCLIDITGQKEAEEKITGQKKYLETILQTTADGFWMVDRSGNITQVNKAYCRMSGYSREELESMCVNDLDAEETPEDTQARIDRIIKNGSDIFQTKHRRKDGTLFDAEISVSFLDIQGGQFVCFGRDISDRIQAENALKTANKKLSSLWNISSLANADFRTICDHVLESIVNMTESLYGFYGFISPDESVMTIHSWSGEAMNGCGIADKPQEFPVSKAGLWGEAIRKREPMICNDYSMDIPGKKGSPKGHVPIKNLMVVPFMVHDRMITVAAVANRQGDYTTEDISQITTFLTGIQAITERMEGEEVLRKSEKQLALTTDNFPGLVSILDTNLCFKFASNGFEKLLGASPKKIIGKKIADVIGEENYAIAESHLKSALSGKTAVYESHSRVAMGRVVQGLNTIVPDIDADGNVSQLFVFGIDISDRKRMEDERLVMEKKLLHSQKLESLGVLAGGIAHDFNNLLLAVIGNLDMSLVELSPVSASRKYIESSMKAAQRAADLTRQMLAYSGKGHFIINDININELIQENLHILKSSVSKNVTVHLSLSDGISCISADVAQMQQVVMNFITNASEAIGEMQGSIHIATGVMDCDEAYLEKSLAEEKPPAGRYVYLEVRDTGCGMDEETKQRIFDPFFTTKFTGRGLGMAAVIGIVRGHKGAVFIESEAGRGTTVRVLFPAVDRKLEVKAEKLRVEQAETDNCETSDKKVLIVDDEEFVLDMCNEMVMSFGYQTLTAEDGMKAVEIYGEHYKEIDCVILDLSMPRMSGYETFLKLKKLNPDVKVILSSGYEKEEATRKFERESLAGFVQKPYRMKSLRAELAKS